MSEASTAWPDLVPVRRALLSVWDKAGIVSLARCLASFGCELVSSGGTRQHLEAAGIPTIDVAAVTGNPAAFDGRMKTISFALEGALLFDRTRHADEAARLGIVPIDMVVCTFYPFEEAVARGCNLEELVEHIDVGGPTMVRAAAKNAAHVAVVTDPADYATVEAELTALRGALSLKTRLLLMRKAFAKTADYEDAIASALDACAGERSLRLALERGRPTRYGENPHQAAMVYRVRGAPQALHDCELLHGKELSYNNIVDVQRALEAVRDLPRHGVAVIKHGNPCGLADACEQRRAMELAWAGDPVSAFGSVIACSTPMERATAEFFGLDHPDKARRKFIEVVVAPSFEPEALSLLARHKTLRLVVADPRSLTPSTEVRIALGTALVQEPDVRLLERLAVVSEARCELDEGLVEFGLVAVRALSSNAIAVVRRLPEGACQLLGMGCGQPNRVGAMELALHKSAQILSAERPHDADPGEYERLCMGEALVVSDGFLPFPDNVDVCARYGVRVIVQPGGSLRDEAVIARANELGITMVFTGIRHFRH